MNNSPDNNSGRNYDFDSLQVSRSANNQNPYARSYNEDNAEYSRNSAVRRQSAEYDMPGRRKVRKKQPAFKFNWGLFIFLLIIAAVIAFSVAQIAKRAPEKPEDDYVDPPIDDVTDPEGGEEADGGDEIPDDPDESGMKTFTVTVSNGDEDSGDLILVNYDHDFSENADYIPVVNVYEKRSTPFKVASTDIELSPVVFAAFEEMVKDLEAETGCDDLIINSGYRTMQDQQDIYDYYLEEKGEEYVRDYVANPGESEHHTGFAADLSFFLDEGYSENIGTHEHGAWLTEHCSDYGFVVRYPEDKVEYTHIAYEAWHFRYVGVVHARAMTSLGLCLEEYIDLIEDCRLGEKVLFISDSGKASLMYTDALPEDGGYAVYYFPAEEDGNTEFTIIGEEGADYSYSGTNGGGFIVTVPLG